ncbi:MAG: hypothetical protein HRU07_10275 [Nitrosopumilus sp.]|nr:hypothetical protein [Nitrosopumilus sp.]
MMFDKELNTIAQAKNILSSNKPDKVDYKEAFEELLSQYEELLSETQFLTTMSDRLQRKLNSNINDLHVQKQSVENQRKIIQQQNAELTLKKDTLEFEVEQRTIELKQSLEDLIAANTELDNFVYRASHDIRGPIARLLGICNIASLESTDNKTKGYFNLLTENAHEISAMLDRLLYVNTLKHSEIQKDLIEVRPLLEHVRLGLADLDNYTICDINFDVNIDHPIYHDEKILEILLKNLLENAIVNYVSPPTSDKRLELNLKLELSGNILFIHLHYTGYTIPEESIPYLFDLFHRYTLNSKALGLELYTAKLATKKLEGELKLDFSKENETQFTCKVPNVLK